ncbi:MAG: hypothetical protein K8H85_10305 [Cyclobacteriaceae bacterium]|nr:hypothetical protein [Cyclobacteriaceae bacterium]
MTTEDKLKAMKAINSEIEKLENISSKLAAGPGSYHIEITAGMVDGVLAVCKARKDEMIKEAQILMKTEQ